MSGLQSYVKGNRNSRPESPHYGQAKINPHRAAQAANLKVQMRAEVARPGTVRSFQGLHGHGESITQNQSAFTQQQHLERQQSGEGPGGDLYDTDAASIDTTVNRSVIQVENTQPYDQQQFQPENQEDETGDEEGDYDEDEFDGQLEFAEDVQQYLDETGYAQASYDEQIQWLRQTKPHIFPTVDGDSYPTTTEGNLTEVSEQQEQPLEHPDPTLPSPQGLVGQGQPPIMFNQQAQRSHHTPDTQQTLRLYQQGAQLRVQQRLESSAQGHNQRSQQHSNVAPPTSQPPNHSQTIREQGLAAPSTASPRPGALAPSAQGGLPQRSSRVQPAQANTQNSVPGIAGPATAFRHVPDTRSQIVPMIQQPVEPAPVEPSLVDESLEYVGDYDRDTLYNMKYDTLRDESFDKNPREQELTLPEDMQEQPLVQRLQFAQQKLDPLGQAQFFSALPTTEWEEAGDWFLDRFATIISRTREARQKKRRQAQSFEEEIEARHQCVAKKRRLISGAMAKMQEQGEKLVPKSPRASKSPRPRGS